LLSIKPLRGFGTPRCRAVCLVAITILGLALPPVASVPATYAQAPVRSLEIVPIAHVGGPVTSVVRHGEHAYAIAGRRLIVFDVADPRSPDLVGESIDVPAGASLLAAGDGLLVLKANPSRLVDVSDLVRPVLLGGALPIGDALSVVVADRVIFAADGSSGLRVVDATDPRRPSLIASLRVGGVARRVALAERRLIMTRAVARGDPESTNALLVIDVKDPYAPSITGELALETDPGGLAVGGARALVDGRRDGYGTVIAVDLSEEDRPRVVGEVRAGWPIEPLAIDGDVAWGWNQVFAVRGTNGLTRIPLGEWPSIDVPTATQLALGSRRSVISFGDTALVASGYSGLGVIGDDVPQPFPFPVLGSGGTPVIDGDQLWMADDDLEIWSVDIQDPRAPVLRGSHQLWPGRWKNFAFGVDLFRSEEVIGATIPAGWFIYGLLETLEPGPGFEPRHLGLWLPSEVETIEASIFAGDRVVTSGDRAYVAGDHTGMLHEFDLSDPATPRLARTFDAKHDRSGIAVAVTGEHAWLSMQGTGIAVIDLAAPDGMLREVMRLV